MIEYLDRSLLALIQLLQNYSIISHFEVIFFGIHDCFEQIRWYATPG